jgi:hypothetical protein
MAIAASDIHYRLSGGAGNADPLLSLGGVKSTATDAGANIFPDVPAGDAATGKTQYRGVVLHNAHGSLTYLGVKVWVDTDTPSPDTDADIALALEAVNVTMATIANDTTAPAGVTFTNAAVSEATGLSIGDIPFSQFKGIWLKRVVNPGAVSYSDSFSVSAKGSTAP